MKKFYLLLPVIVALLLPAIASAQSVIVDYANEPTQKAEPQWTGFVAAGAAMLPEYDGSEDYQQIPIAAIQLNKGNRYIATRGLGVVANVLDSENFNFGPVLRYRFGRDGDVENATISQLRELDDSVEIGAFASVIRRNQLMPGDNAELSFTAIQDVAGGHGGYLSEIGASYFVPLRRDLRVGVSTDIQYQSSDYMDAYFSIDADNAARSGLSQYQAEDGFNRAGLSLQTIYSFDRNWGLFGLVNYSRFMGDAADSPIIEDEGSPNQLFGALAVTYRY